jgi:hypothetical protein
VNSAWIDPCKVTDLRIMGQCMTPSEMQAFEAELIARIQRGEAIHITRKWFLEKLAYDDKDPGYLKDLTPFLRAFFNQIMFAFEAWQREQNDEARKRPKQ